MERNVGKTWKNGTNKWGFELIEIIGVDNAYQRLMTSTPSLIHQTNSQHQTWPSNHQLFLLILATLKQSHLCFVVDVETVAP